MGEWSKKVGENGEKLVKEFFELIGWTSSQENLEMACIRSERHQCKTHGIDRLFMYKSPLEDGVLNNIVTSVKFTSKQYPDSPNNSFKGHFFDLSKTIECFKNSEIRKSVIKNFSGIDSCNNIGVLFWLSNVDHNDRDILLEVAKCKNLDEFSYETIYLVDNKRISFIYDSIHWLRSAFPNKSNEFFYPSTGKNINPQTKTSSGAVLPVEYVNSSILLFKSVDLANDSKTLVISTIENFSSAGLKRLIGLAQDISHDLTNSTLILFPDYDHLNHSNSINEAKAGFVNQSFVSTVKIRSFRGDFRSMLNE